MDSKPPSKRHSNRSFRGQDLSGEDFRYCDLRGADFRNAILVGADFSYAKLGLSHQSSTVLAGVSIFLAVITGLFPLQIGPMEVVCMQDNKYTALVASLVILVGLPTLLAVAARRGFKFAVRKALFIFFVALLTPYCLVWIGIIRDWALTGGGLVGLIVGPLGAGLLLAGASTFAIAIVIAGLVSTGLAYFVTATGLFSALAGFAGGIGFMAALLTNPKEFLSVTETTRQAVENSKALATTIAAPSRAIPGSEPFAGITILVAAGIVAGLGCYLGWQILSGSDRYSTLKQVAVTLCSKRGTQFENANLRNANFTQARVKNSNFVGATLTRTRWAQSQGLLFANFSSPELANPHIRALVTTAQGVGQNFTRQNLSALNLREANLRGANLVSTDLSGSDLQNADLSEAILVRSQLDEVNLQGANLTGACIEDWGITKTTQIQGIDCQYVFLSWVDGQKQERFPQGRAFQPNEFVQFLSSLRDTLDLRHSEPLNPRAALIALSQLSEQYGKPLEILVVEQREQHSIIKLKSPQGLGNLESTQLKMRYSELYRVATQHAIGQPSAIEQKIQTFSRLLEEGRHKSIVIIKNLDNYGGIVASGDITLSKSHLAPTRSSGDINSNSAPDVAYIQTILGNPSNQPNRNKYTKNYQQVLINFHRSVAQETAMTFEAKVEAQEQIERLAHSWQRQADPLASKAVQESLNILRGLAQEFPQAVEFNHACQKLLPPIIKLLGH